MIKSKHKSDQIARAIVDGEHVYFDYNGQKTKARLYKKLSNNTIKIYYPFQCLWAMLQSTEPFTDPDSIEQNEICEGTSQGNCTRCIQCSEQNINQPKPKPLPSMTVSVLDSIIGTSDNNFVRWNLLKEGGPIRSVNGQSQIMIGDFDAEFIITWRSDTYLDEITFYSESDNFDNKLEPILGKLVGDCSHLGNNLSTNLNTNTDTSCQIITLKGTSGTFEIENYYQLYVRAKPRYRNQCQCQYQTSLSVSVSPSISITVEIKSPTKNIFYKVPSTKYLKFEYKGQIYEFPVYKLNTESLTSLNILTYVYPDLRPIAKLIKQTLFLLSYDYPINTTSSETNHLSNSLLENALPFLIFSGIGSFVFDYNYGFFSESLFFTAWTDTTYATPSTASTIDYRIDYTYAKSTFIESKYLGLNVTGYTIYAFDITLKNIKAFIGLGENTLIAVTLGYKTGGGRYVPYNIDNNPILKQWPSLTSHTADSTMNITGFFSLNLSSVDAYLVVSGYSRSGDILTLTQFHVPDPLLPIDLSEFLTVNSISLS